MKREFLLLFGIMMIVCVSFSSAECSLAVSLVSQDPYPAVPGDYVDIVFQVSGVENPDCGDVSFELLDSYPLKFDPGFNPNRTLKAGTFSRGYTSAWIVPYKVRLDSDALDGESEVEVIYSTKGSRFTGYAEKFNITIEDTRANFQIFVKSYDYTSRKLSIEVLNNAQNDVYALVLSVPPQDTIKIFGANQKIVGDLDSNDYTSTDFEAMPTAGEIEVKIEYSDVAGERRAINKKILFEPGYFEHTKPNNSTKIRNYAIAVIVVALAVWWFFRRKKKLIK
jgi:hypothetical protein